MLLLLFALSFSNESFISRTAIQSIFNNTAFPVPRHHKPRNHWGLLTPTPTLEARVPSPQCLFISAPELAGTTTHEDQFPPVPALGPAPTRLHPCPSLFSFCGILIESERRLITFSLISCHLLHDNRTFSKLKGFLIRVVEINFAVLPAATEVSGKNWNYYVASQ